MDSSNRTECFNCTQKVEFEGDAFCIECTHDYFVCANCSSIDLLDNVNIKQGEYTCDKCIKE